MDKSRGDFSLKPPLLFDSGVTWKKKYFTIVIDLEQDAIFFVKIIP